MRRLYRVRRFEFWLAMAALLGVVTFGTPQGVFIGITLSLVWLVSRASNPAMPVLGRSDDTRVYRDVSNDPGARTVPGVVVMPFDGPLYFATASGLRARIRELIDGAEPPVQAVVLDMEACAIIDLEGSDELDKVVKELHETDVTFYLARIKRFIRQTLEHDGVIDTTRRIGTDDLFDHVYEAVDAAQGAIDESDSGG